MQVAHFVGEDRWGVLHLLLATEGQVRPGGAGSCSRENNFQTGSKVLKRE